MFYRVSVWGKQGERCARFLHKGDRCAAFGDFFMQEYKKNSGETAFAHEVENATVEFLNEKNAEHKASKQEPLDDDEFPI